MARLLLLLIIILMMAMVMMTMTMVVKMMTITMTTMINQPTCGGTGLRSGARKSQAVSNIVSREPSAIFIEFIEMVAVQYFVL